MKNNFFRNIFILLIVYQRVKKPMRSEMKTKWIFQNRIISFLRKQN